MEPGFAFVSAAAGVAVLATAGQIAVLRARLRRRRSRAAEVRQVRLVGPHASKLAAFGLAAFAVGAVAYALGTFVGVLAMSLGLLVLGFAVSNAVGLRMVTTGDPSWTSHPRSAMRDAALVAAGVILAGAAVLVGTRDAGRLLWLIPMAACALAGFAIVRAISAPIDVRGKDGP